MQFSNPARFSSHFFSSNCLSEFEVPQVICLVFIQMYTQHNMNQPNILLALHMLGHHLLGICRYDQTAKKLRRAVLCAWTSSQREWQGRCHALICSARNALGSGSAAIGAALCAALNFQTMTPISSSPSSLMNAKPCHCNFTSSTLNADRRLPLAC